MAILKISEKESKQISRRKGLKEAESYGWEVPDDMANEAYEFACEYFGKNEMNEQIINCISNEELAACLAFLFRNWDFREWNEYLEGNNEEDFDESYNMRETNRELNTQFDSRKSFYGKAHVVTDDDGTEILYSYDTPVVKIKDGKVELLAQWDSSQTTLRHVKEFLQQNGFKVGSKAQIAKMYGRAVESVNKHFRRNIKESKGNINYVVFRKYYNEYTDTYEPIAFYWGNDIPATYGSINITEQDGIVPHMKTPRYIHDEADIRYISKTKKLTSNDECYNDFTKFVIDELSEDGYNVAVKQKVDYDAVRNSWRR